MSKLQGLHSRFPPGAPLDSADLFQLGVSADLGVHYVKTGWLNRLSRGVYCRPDAPLALNPSLRFMERRLAGLHVGGKSALDWRGIRHNVSQAPPLQLYGWTAGQLPNWFTDAFPSEYHRQRLFTEQPDALLHVSRLTRQADSPLVSEPERALLEMLNDVGVRQPLEEARDIMEGAASLRAKVLESLLAHCSRVKTVRLCLTLGKELGLPWATRLDTTRLPTGSQSAWVGRNGRGLMVLKP